MKYISNHLKQLIAIIVLLSLVVTSVPHSFAQGLLAVPGEREHVSSGVESKLKKKIKPENIFTKREEAYKKTMDEQNIVIERIGQADIVVCIPFVNEVETIGNVVEVALQGLNEVLKSEELKSYLRKKKVAVICCGERVGREALKVIGGIQQEKWGSVEKISFRKKSDLIKGKDWSARAMMEIGKKLGAHCVFLDADIRPDPDWIRLLVAPILKHEVDVVLAEYITPYYSGIISSNFIYPLFASVYGWEIPWPISKEYGISYGMLDTYIENFKEWQSKTGSKMRGYGTNAKVTSQALVKGKLVYISRLGLRGHERIYRKIEERLRPVIETVFEEVAENSDWWLNKFNNNPAIQPLPVYGKEKRALPGRIELDYKNCIKKYKRDFDNPNFNSLYRNILPQEIYIQLENLRKKVPKNFDFSSKLWATIVYHFLLAYRFLPQERQRIIGAFIPLYWARVGSFVKEIESFRDSLAHLSGELKETSVHNRVKQKIDEQKEDFKEERDFFFTRWQKETMALESYLPLVDFFGIVPGVKLVIPEKMEGIDGKVANAKDIYSELYKTCREDLIEFLKKFGLFIYTPFEKIARVLSEEFQKLEQSLNDLVLPGQLEDIEDLKKITDDIFSYISPKEVRGLSNRSCYNILSENFPENLMGELKCPDLESLLEFLSYKLKRKCELEDILALANWTEDEDYRKTVYDWMIKNKDLIKFENKKVMLLVVDPEDPDFKLLLRSVSEIKEQTGFPRLVARVVVTTLPKGMGGELPKIRYLTTITKNTVEIERFSRVWEGLEEKPDFIEKILRSLDMHYGYSKPLSVHNIYENGNQIETKVHLEDMASALEKEPQLKEISQLLKDLLSGYFCFFTLLEGEFLTCCMWTVASRSFKGGTGYPDYPSHVENNWFSWKLLVEYLKAAGLEDENTIEKRIFELIRQGKEPESLGYHLLKLPPGLEDSLVPGTRRRMRKEPKIKEGAVTLLNNGMPIIKPTDNVIKIKERDKEKIVKWEVYVLNTGASNKISGWKDIYLLYRAFGEDNTSRIGLALAEYDAQDNIVRIKKRFPFPIFWPQKDYEGIHCTNPKKYTGCEDPRIVIFGDRICIEYTAMDGERAQIARASILKEKFLEAIKISSEENWKEVWKDAWYRHGLVFPGYVNKDAVLLPEQIMDRDGKKKFLEFHRITPGISFSLHDTLECPWPRYDCKVLEPPLFGENWFSKRLGEGSNILKTKYGWLHIIHGADQEEVYSLGVWLTELKNPTRTLYFSPNPILKPEKDEKEEDTAKYWKRNVRFTCGAVPLTDKEILDENDEILIFYGKNDTVICVGKARIGDLIPEEVRNRGLSSSLTDLTGIKKAEIIINKSN